MTCSAAIAAAYMLATSQSVFRHSARLEPTDYLPPCHASHDAERIAKAEAKRARKAAKRAKRAKLLEAQP